jgi:hypothetical protein
MAIGDIKSCSIESTGWYADIEVEGLSTGGTYNFGYGTDLNPDDANVVFTLISETFNSVGTPTTKSRTIYGTKAKRKAYPDQAVMDETVDGSDVIIRVALSEWIYPNDTSITVDIAGGFYTQGGTSNSAANDLVVTNNSTQGYFPTIANWSIPLHGRRMGFNELTGENNTSGNFEVRLIAYHRDGKVPCIKVTATGVSSAHVETIYLTSESISQSTYNDALPIAEFIGLIPIAGFTQGENVTLNFIAYPNVGDATTVMDSSATGKSMPTSWPCPQIVICDKSHTYGTAVAVVDSVSGNDETGAVTSLELFNPSSPPNSFLTIGGAALAIRTYNNANYSRNEYGGGIIYLKAGNYAFLGGAAITAAVSTTYIQITPFPGVERSNVVFNSQSGSRNIGTYLMLNNVTINTTALLSNNTGYTYTLIWFHKLDFISTGSTHYYAPSGIQYFTANKISFLTQGVIPYTSGEHTYSFVRGNTIDTIQKYCAAHVAIGNLQTSGNLSFQDYHGGVGALQGCIINYNKMTVTVDFNPSVYLQIDSAGNNAIGQVIMNNSLEKPVLGSIGLLWVCADGTGQYNIDNVIMEGNTVSGQKSNIAYNDTTLNDVTPPAYRRGWSVKNNFIEALNIVTDVHTHGGLANGYRIGNHSLVHGCGLSGNYHRDKIFLTPGTPEFIGLNSIFSDADPKFVDDQSSGGSGGGDGDYNLQADSPLIGKVLYQKLTYDLDGENREINGAIGSYEYPNGSNIIIINSEIFIVLIDLGTLKICLDLNTNDVVLIFNENIQELNMIQGISFGRTEMIVSGDTTYIYKHVNHNASNAEEDWFATRIVTAGDNQSITNKMGCFENYATEW